MHLILKNQRKHLSELEMFPIGVNAIIVFLEFQRASGTGDKD